MPSSNAFNVIKLLEEERKSIKSELKLVKESNPKKFRELLKKLSLNQKCLLCWRQD